MTLSVVDHRKMVQFVRRGEIYASEDHWIFKSSDHGLSWQTVCRLETRRQDMVGRMKDSLLRTRMARSLRRNIGIHNVVVLPSGTVIAQYDGIYRFDGTGDRAKRVYSFYDHGLYGPLRNGFVVDDRSGNIYFGEYNNQRPYGVSIVRGRDDGRTWEVCHQFPAGRIKHIHSLVPDPYRNRLWICTGDNNQEAGLFYTDDDFRTVHLFKGGEQCWRLVSLIPQPDALIWGSDAGQDAPADAINHIYRWDFGTERLEQLACIDKPAYYSTGLQDGSLILGTTFEPALKRPVQASADIWYSKDGWSWEALASFPFHPSGRPYATRYATVNLPLGDKSLSRLLVTPENVRKHDFCVVSIDIDG